MLILKIVGMAFLALFLILMLKQSGSALGVLLALAAGALMILVIFDPLKEIMIFLQTMSDKANIDTVYIGIVLKIIGIAYMGHSSWLRWITA